MTDRLETDAVLAAIEDADADRRAQAAAVAALEVRHTDLTTILQGYRQAAEAAALEMAEGKSAARDAYDAAGRECAAVGAALSAVESRLLPQARSALQSAEAAHAALCRQAAYDEAARQSDLAQARLRDEYPALAASFRDLLTVVTLASSAVEAVNRDRPPGAPLLPDPEAAVRDIPAKAPEVLAEEEVERWVVCESGKILTDAAAAASVVTETETTGYIAPAAHGLAQPARTVKVEKRPCVLSIVSPEARQRRGSRLSQMNFPALSGDGRAFWSIPRSALMDASWTPPLERVLDVLFTEDDSHFGLPRTRSEIRLK